MIRLCLIFLFASSMSFGATIAIIDTGFDLDHHFLRPKILQKDSADPDIDFQGWDFFDNSHLKKPVIEDKSSLQEILLYRNLRAKGHGEGLNEEEFTWYNKKSADKEFMEKVHLFKRHSHGTFVAGIALREGENISILPIRGLNLPTPVVAVEDNTVEGTTPLKGKTPEAKFEEEIKNSRDRVTRKFSKICRYVDLKKIEIVNASYGISYKSLVTKFRERYKEMTGREIDEVKLTQHVDHYFQELYLRSERTMRKHPNILFVFSAGNSGLDNDRFHHYPSRIKVPNAISVAAMNGDYLATFSNFGKEKVDIGAPGVAILSLVPKVYSEDGTDIYSPASGTSMAAPYISNLAAQIMNTNPKLSPPEIRRIILETGDEKPYLKERLLSGAIVNNQKALKAALLSKDMPLSEAIILGRSGLIPMEDSISIGSPEEVKQKVMESFPSLLRPSDADEEPGLLEGSTKSSSSSPTDPGTGPQDSSGPLPSEAPGARPESADPVPSSQTSAQSPLPSAGRPASSSEPPPQPLSSQSPESSPSSPQ